MTYRDLLEQRRKRLEKAEKALDLLSDPDIQAQLASDAEMRTAFLNAIHAKNGNDAPVVPVWRGPQKIGSKLLPPEGSLLRAVADAAMRQIGDFNAPTLLKYMLDDGYQFAAQDKYIAVSSALKDLQTREIVELVSRGMGRRASVYRYSGPKEEDK